MVTCYSCGAAIGDRTSAHQPGCRVPELIALAIGVGEGGDQVRAPDGRDVVSDWWLVDSARLERHERLLAIWGSLSAEELLADLGVLAQLAAFRHRQELQAAKQQAEEERG